VAAAFHVKGKADVEEIEEAYSLLSPLLGVGNGYASTDPGATIKRRKS
jgi:hypothetical protein